MVRIQPQRTSEARFPHVIPICKNGFAVNFLLICYSSSVVFVNIKWEKSEIPD